MTGRPGSHLPIKEETLEEMIMFHPFWASAILFSEKCRTSSWSQSLNSLKQHSERRWQEPPHFSPITLIWSFHSGCQRSTFHVLHPSCLFISGGILQPLNSPANLSVETLSLYRERLRFAELKEINSWLNRRGIF